MKKFTKTALAILLSLCLCIGMIPLGVLSAAADVNEGGSGQGLQMPTPQNVQATLIGFVVGDTGKAVVVEIEWDALPSDIDGGYKFVEMWPSLKEDENLSLPMSFEAWMGQATLIPVDELTEGGIGYVTKDGRSKLRSVVHILQEGDLKVDENGMACGVKENDKIDIDIYTAGYDPETQTNGESEHKHIEVVYTEENVKNKKTFTAAVEDKTVAPPAEVVLPYTGQPQACPYTDQAGYYVTLNDPETDAGIYTAVLLLRDGYKWTDGSTDGKPAIWAIDKAPITSVTLQNSELTYNSQEQHPVIASVTAGTLTVPAEGYTVSYYETPLYAGKYTLTVKGKGNFTGSASAEFEIFTVSSDTCNHVDYNWRYEDNKDGKTHKVFCWNCGGCLNNSESHQIVYDAIHNQDGEFIGVYNPRCVHCGYEGDSVFCNHTDELEYTDNGLGTHKVTCKRCKKVVAEKEPHKIVTTPITTNVGGIEVYLGQFTYSCEKCDYCAEFTCDHKGTGRIEYTPKNTSYPDYTHIARCEKCLQLLVDDQEACTSDSNWEPSSLTTHTSHCSVCGQVMTGYHDFRGTRKITKFEATPYKGGLFNLFTRYNYRIYYTETCKVCKGVRNGYFDNPMPSSENWADFRSALQSIVNMSPEELQSYANNDILGYGKHYLMIPANMLSLIYEATGTNEMNYANLDSEFLLNFTNTSDEGSCKMFDKNGKEIASHKPNNNKSGAPVGADGEEEEGALESELEMWSFTEDNGAALGVSTDLLMSLEDGEHTLTACFSNDNGDRAAITMVFTIYTTDDGQKALKDLRPAGTMINADGEVVSMNLSKDTLIYTGEALELPAVTLTSEMGVEYAEDEDYTLTYYQVVEGVDGELTEVEVDPEQITEIGTYNIVANPTRNGVLSGSAWVQFVVIDEADCPHNWETLSDSSGHWQHCTICDMSSRIQSHEDGEKTCEVKRVWIPVDGGDDANALLVTVNNECPACGYNNAQKAYNVSYTYPAENYRLAALRDAEINKSGNAIHMKGGFEKDEQIFWDGVLLSKPADYSKDEGSVILTFTDEFLAAAADGGHELIICNGDEFTVMTVTVADNKLAELGEKDFYDYEELDFEEYYNLLADYRDSGVEIIDCDLDGVLPLWGDTNGDGTVDVLDAAAIKKYCVEKITLNETRYAVSDLNNDGTVDVLDATYIQKWCVDLVTDKNIGKPAAFEFDA